MLEPAARRGLHVQVQQEWTHIVAIEWPAQVTSHTLGSLLEAEQVGREAVRGRAMLILLMEAAATRREQGRMSEQRWGGGGGADPGQGGWR